MHFALNCWFRNLFEADRIRPYPPATGLATALQPVLVSARLHGRHFYAGARPRASVFVINDDEDGRALDATRLAWSIEHAGATLARGQQSLPPVAYYHNHETTLVLEIPERLPRPRVDARLVLRLFEGDKCRSLNHYDLILAEKGWVQARPMAQPRVLDAGRVSEPLWKMPGIAPRWTAAIPDMADAPALVVCDFSWVNDAARRERFLKYVASGGSSLLLSPGKTLKALFPRQVKAFREGDFEIVSLRVPESPLFDGLEVMDLRWFHRGDRQTPVASHGDFQLVESPEIEVLAKHLPEHGYLNTQSAREAIEGAVVFTLRYGRGRLWVTQLAMETATEDPVAARVLRNMLHQVVETAAGKP